MPEEEEIDKVEQGEPDPAGEEAREPSGSVSRRRYFTRRKIGLALGGLAIIGVLLALLAVVSYRYGVFDNYVKTQFTVKMAEIGMDFDADVFRVTVNPLELELKN